ncbi:MAG: KpsF/GutQ family sugar-phosphate isomerase [Candidatus Brocadiales bacterium]
MKESSQDIAFAKEVLELEARAVQNLIRGIDDGFQQAVDLIFNCRGRVVVTGIGKAGIVGQKISATLASTGTPSYWLHPVEARHGDLGRVVKEDVVLALSNSGQTEVVLLLPHVKKIGAKVIAITGDKESTLALHSDVVLGIGKVEEPCHLGLAPSASSTAMLAIGDALALTVFKKKDLKKEDFAAYHPGGELGKKLLTVDMVMRAGEGNPVTSESTTVIKALEIMTNTRGGPGAVSIVDSSGRLCGFFTDGDLRRYLQKGRDFLSRPINEVMTKDPRTAKTGSLAADVYRVLREYKIDQLPVVDDKDVPVGLVDVQDLLDVGY